MELNLDGKTILLEEIYHSGSLNIFEDKMLYLSNPWYDSAAYEIKDFRYGPIATDICGCNIEFQEGDDVEEVGLFKSKIEYATDEWTPIYKNKWVAITQHFHQYQLEFDIKMTYDDEYYKNTGNWRSIFAIGNSDSYTDTIMMMFYPSTNDIYFYFRGEPQIWNNYSYHQLATGWLTDQEHHVEVRQWRSNGEAMYEIKLDNVSVLKAPILFSSPMTRLTCSSLQSIR